MNIFYINPQNGLYGGNKVVFEHCQHLAAAHQKCFVISDDAPPDWIKVDAYFVDRATAKRLVSKDDTVIFHWDYDADYAMNLGAGRVYYLIQSFVHLDETLFRRPGLGFIAVSNYIAEHTRVNYGVESTVVLNGIDLGVFYPRPVVRETGRVFAIDRGGVKRVEDIRRAERLVRENFPQIQFVYRDGLTPDQMAVEYSKADIFVSASLREGFGLPVLEAMACGAAVVTTDSKGIDDFASDGVNCRKVPPRDPVRLAEAIVELLKSTAERDRMRERGLQTAARFGWASSVVRLAQIFGLTRKRATTELFRSMTEAGTLTTTAPDKKYYGRQKVYRATWVSALKRYRGGLRLSRALKLIGLQETSVTGDFDYQKVAWVDRVAETRFLNAVDGAGILYVPDLAEWKAAAPIDIVILGSEESCAVTDFGYRPMLFGEALSRSVRVGKVMVVHRPISAARRIADMVTGKKCLGAVYPSARKGAGWEVFKVHERFFLMNLTDPLPAFAKGLSGISDALVGRALTDALRQLGWTQPAVWVVSPWMTNLADGMDASVKAFDAIDDLTAHPAMTASLPAIRRGYRWAQEHTDFITIASEGQKNQFDADARLMLLPNGTDSSFARRSEAAQREHLPQTDTLPTGPIAGYVGVIQDRMDIDLITRTAVEMPEFNFVFVGPVHEPVRFEPLSRLPNVLFTGRKAYSEIPAYMGRFDVCILPHRKTSFTESMNPLKIYEYLSCGKPIVATSVAGTAAFSGLIELADDAKTFAAAIRRAAAQNTPALEAARRSAAAAQSLDLRAESLIDRLQSVAALKSRSADGSPR